MGVTKTKSGKASVASSPRKTIGGTAFIVTILTFATLSAAHADTRGGHPGPRGGDRNWHAHADHAHHYWNGRPQPGVVYAPPVVYSPPPEYEAPGLNLIIPLHIR